mmetsp:Transcript_21446/g.50608  ORF Transcript_21446/g.50608 Transcript_21446/m.50608 type:complete len:221 (+) Transcript_21446:493-1155(+)
MTSAASPTLVRAAPRTSCSDRPRRVKAMPNSNMPFASSLPFRTRPDAWADTARICPSSPATYRSISSNRSSSGLRIRSPAIDVLVSENHDLIFFSVDNGAPAPPGGGGGDMGGIPYPLAAMSIAIGTPPCCPSLRALAWRKVASSALRNVSKHAASRSSGWTATRRRNTSRSCRRCSTKAGVKRDTACFSGMGGMMAPARSRCSRSYSQLKSEYLRRTAE